MADSDRSRSPVPMRNRLDSRGQPPPQSFTILSEMVWSYECCGSTLPEHATTSGPTSVVDNPVRTSDDGTYVDTTSSSNQLGITAVSTNSTHQFLATYTSIPTATSMPSYYTLSTHTTVSTDTALLAKHTIHFSITATVNWHSKIGSWIKATQQRSLQNLRLRPQSTLARGPGSLRQPED